MIPDEAVEAAYQVLPAASGYWNLYRTQGGTARFVDKFLSEKDAHMEAKRRGWVK